MLFKLLTTHTFDELHKKLLTFETSLQAKTKIEVNFPITANPMNMTASARHLITMHEPPTMLLHLMATGLHDVPI